MVLKRAMKETLAKNLHLWLTAVLSLALLPCLLVLRIPPRFDWGTLFLGWVNLGIQSAFLASILYLITFALKETLIPACGHFYRRFFGDKLKCLLLLLVIAVTIWRVGIAQSIIRIGALLGMIELIARCQESHRSFSKLVFDLLLPGAYLFLGFVLIFGYNNVIASQRFYGAYDVTFNRLDAWLLNGTTVSDISHSVVSLFPNQFFHFLEFIYFGMFPQIGAGVVITCLYFGRRQALQLVGTILIAYYLALICYYLWPSLGPFYICPAHFLEFPNTLESHSIQKQLLVNLEALGTFKSKDMIGTDYFIAFPCMHIVQPLIVMWFLRRLRRIIILLGLFNLLLVPSIILLEWHYIVDLFGGLAVACFAIVIAGLEAKEKQVSKQAELASV